MSRFFPEFDQANIHLIPYEYRPISDFIAALHELNSKVGGSTFEDQLVGDCKKYFNQLLSARPVSQEYVDTIKGRCKTIPSHTTQTINNLIGHIHLDRVVTDVLEQLVLGNDFNTYGLLFESEEQWDFFYNILKDSDLDSMVIPITKKAVREQYFDIPIITFLPASWMPEQILLPPSENLFLIHPHFLRSFHLNQATFTAPNNDSIELSSERAVILENEAIVLDVDDTFDKAFPGNSDTKKVIPTAIKDFMESNRALNLIDIKDVSQRTHCIEVNKRYFTITKAGELGFTSFENEQQLSNIAYLILELDHSDVTEEAFRRAKNSMMEEWKKPLREYPEPTQLPSKLKELGAIKATPQNIKNWADPNRIAPRSAEDFRAVLLFAGMKDESEINRFFTLVHDQRGAAISLGHQNSELSNHIVENYLKEALTGGSAIDMPRQILGIRLDYIELGFIEPVGNICQG